MFNTQMTTTPVDAALMDATRQPDFEKLKAIGARLAGQFMNYERDRRLAELRWAKNARQFLGIYDPDVERELVKGRSKAYPKLTRVKCVSMLSRMMNLLFPSNEKNWTVTASPVPNLSEEDLQLVLDTLQISADPNVPLEDKLIEMAVVEFAKARSENLEREIEDQLAEIGGSRMVDYVSLCRKVLMSGIIYGMGVLKGPFIRMQQQRTWERDIQTGQIRPVLTNAFRPQYDFVSLWDYYPDMSAKYLHQMDGQYQRIVMARHQVRELADKEGFFGDVIKKYLIDHPKGNYKRRTYESEIKAMGVQNNINDQDGRKYEILVWDGYIPARDLAAAGEDIPEDQMGDQIEAIVWLLDGEVIKADMNPWVRLDVDQKVNTYHHFIFEEDESTITGNGLPNIMRDSQMGVASSARMILDNSSVVCGPNLEVNLDLVRMDQDLTSIHAYKTWYREGVGPEASVPAIREIKFDSHIDELLKVANLFREFADTETFINPATGGDMSKGPSEPFRTATGASMLKGDQALPFKDVVRNFDLFTQSVISSLVAFNMQFNPKRTIQGDHQVIPKGSTSLIAKEVRGMTLDNLAATLSPDDARYINRYDLLRERLATRDIDLLSGIVCDKDEAKRRDESASQAQQAQQQQTAELLRAEVRKILAEATKNLTQADKNSAAADKTQSETLIDTLNAALGTLEGGVDVGNAEGDTGKPASGAGEGKASPPQQQGRGNGPSPIQVANNPVGAVTG
jgi:hypothetical protein